MRLEKKDIQNIKEVIHSKISDAKIYLFGSRVDDAKKGGDIDLFVKTSQDIKLKDELTILTLLELNGILRKVDLIVDTPNRDKSEFFKTIEKEAIIL